MRLFEGVAEIEEDFYVRYFLALGGSLGGFNLEKKLKEADGVGLAVPKQQRDQRTSLSPSFPSLPSLPRETSSKPSKTTKTAKMTAVATPFKMPKGLSWEEECRLLKQLWDSHPASAEYEAMDRALRIGEGSWGNMVSYTVEVSVAAAPRAADSDKYYYESDEEDEDDDSDSGSEADDVDDGNTNPSLRIGNLSTASDRKVLLATLNAEFGKFGPLRDVNLPIDRATGNCRGFAFIEFREPRDASRALRALFGKLKVGGRDIRIEYAASQRKSTAEMAAAYGAMKSAPGGAGRR